MLDLSKKLFSLNSEQQKTIVVMVGDDNQQVKVLTNRNDTSDRFK